VTAPTASAQPETDDSSEEKRHSRRSDSSKEEQSGTTLERQAADAVANGKFRRAIELYEQLSKEHPDQPVYREAARILRKKLGRNPSNP